MKKDYKMYLTLFSSTFFISAFTFGGGYVIVPLIKEKFVDELGWIEEDEMYNLIAVAQTAPGPIAINTSFLLGYKLAGILGGVITVLGAALPPLIIISIISFFYDSFRSNHIVNAVLKGMQAGIAAVITSVVITMASRVVHMKKLHLNISMIIAFIATFFFNVNVFIVILASGLVGALAVKYSENKEKKKKEADQ